MAKLRFNNKINVSRVVTKVIVAVIALYVGGTIMTQIGNVMNCTSSPFYPGLSLIGWSVGSVNATTCSGLGSAYTTNTIYSTAGSGVLAVIGIIAIGSIVTEFVRLKM